MMTLCLRLVHSILKISLEILALFGGTGGRGWTGGIAKRR